MDRIKTFFKYFLLLVLLYIFSNIMINAFLKVSFSELTNYEIDYNEKDDNYFCVLNKKK